MKRVIIVFTLMAVFVSGYYFLTLVVAPPTKTEALYTGSGGILVYAICESCTGRWYECCQDSCYKQYLHKTHTDDYFVNRAKYEECLDDCVITNASICNNTTN